MHLVLLVLTRRTKGIRLPRKPHKGQREHERKPLIWMHAVDADKLSDSKCLLVLRHYLQLLTKALRQGVFWKGLTGLYQAKQGILLLVLLRINSWVMRSLQLTLSMQQVRPEQQQVKPFNP